MTRKALKDFTFSDGTFIPQGSFVSAAEAPTHFDEANYECADVFNPWRFVDEEDMESMKNQMVTTSTEYVTFGHGRFAWWVICFTKGHNLTPTDKTPRPLALEGSSPLTS